MSLLKTLLESQNGGLMKQLAGNFNIDESQAGAAVAQLLPALTAGMKKNMASPDGLSGLMKALQGGNHERFLKDPGALMQPEAVQEGNGILGHLLGSKEVSRQVAAEASQKTGLDVGILKKMLPMIAAMTMGSASKQVSSAGPAAAASPQGMGMFTKFLDSDGDGSVADDLMGLAKKFF